MKLSHTLLALAVTTMTAGPAVAQEWPERPINVVVPFQAGGSTDLVARSFSTAINENDLLPQPVSVTNVSGHFSVGARRVLDARPNGYEFLVHETGLIGAEAAGIIDFGYEDYEPVALTGEICMAILARKDSNYNNLTDLLLSAAKDSNSIVFGVTLGGLNHMSGIMLENNSDADFRFAQVGGSADNYAALTGGQTDVASVGAAGARNYTMTDDGEISPESKVKTLALLADEPDPRLPGVSTAKEQGVDVSFCFGNYWFAPKDTPDEIVSAFADALEEATDTDRIQTFYDDTLTTPKFLREDEFSDYLEQEAEIIRPIAKQAADK